MSQAPPTAPTMNNLGTPGDTDAGTFPMERAQLPSENAA